MREPFHLTVTSTLSVRVGGIQVLSPAEGSGEDIGHWKEKCRSRQFSKTPGTARTSKSVAAEKAHGEADQDRSPSPSSRPLRDFSEGRSVAIEIVVL